MFIQSFSIVYKQWGFNDWQIGMAFCSIGVGYCVAWALFIPAIKRNIKERATKPDDEKAQYESRLWFLLYTAPCLPIGLIIFAWTCTGPPLHWIGSMIAAAIIGIANYSIYMATIDYMICAYGPYSASATGGNGWSRDFLAGVLTIPATPFFTSKPFHTRIFPFHILTSSTDIGKPNNLAYANTILFCISFLLVIAVYVIYWKGPVLRKRSPFAQQLSQAREDTSTPSRRLSRVPSAASVARRQSFARSQQDLGVRRTMGSRNQSYARMEKTSQRNSPAVSRTNSRARAAV